MPNPYTGVYNSPNVDIGICAGISICIWNLLAVLAVRLLFLFFLAVQLSKCRYMHLRWYIYMYMESLGVLGGLGGSIVVPVFLGGLGGSV
jgi:hypothetical protein